MTKPEEIAKQLLTNHAAMRTPVSVKLLAKALGARISVQPFDGDDVSGMLFRDGAKLIIGVNATHAETRQRFTIAHEIGHLVLHPGRPIILDRVVRVNLRDSLSGMATDREEIEANQFAASLLMPRDLVVGHVEKMLKTGHRLSEDDLVTNLAKVFEVSSQAMEYRLTNLGILPTR